MIRRALLALSLLVGLAPSARADFAFTLGSGATAFSFTSTTGGTSLCAAASTHCFASVPINTAGAQLFKTTNPGVIAGTAASGAALAGNPVRVGISDGTNAQDLLAAIALADGVNGNNTAATASWFWNGATYDRARGDTTNGAWVNVKTSVLPTGAASAANQATEIASLASIDTKVGSAVPAGTAIIGQVGIDQTTDGTTNAVHLKAGTAIAGKFGIDQTTPGTTNAVRDIAGANGGATPLGNIAANNTTAVVVKASAGTLFGVQLAGIGSAPAYLKIYDATSATCGSGTPVKRLLIPAASTAANGAGSNISFGSVGVNFSTGITYCVTTGITDADSTAPAASTFLVNLEYN